MNNVTRSALFCALFFSSTYASACTSCGCTLSSDWDSQGIVTKAGFRVDMRYDYLDQSQLRSGTGTVNRSDYPAPQDRELEQGTKNNYYTLGLDYSPNADWGVTVQIPVIDRSHTTIAPDDMDVSSSHTRSLGDVRVIGRYQGFMDSRNIGLQFGIKLPTGSHDDNFNGGPQDGQPLDRGLQPGSGTRDALLGLYTFGTLNQAWDYFAQGLLQVALDAKNDYRVGTSFNVNFGARYMESEIVIPQLQINIRHAQKDNGLNADIDNSGGTLAYLSPGVTVALDKKTKLFGFLQLPIYQNVNGFQLAPHWTASLGARHEF